MRLWKLWIGLVSIFHVNKNEMLESKQENEDVDKEKERKRE